MEPIRVTVWNEFIHERQNAAVQAIYPKGIHEAIAAGLRQHPGFEVRTRTLSDVQQGLGSDTLESSDVLIYWGHAAHDQVLDETVERVQKRVLDGMGLVVLHSGHWSKLFKRLMGTSCALRYREAGERERIWTVNPGHPIAEGVGDYIELEASEMYGEPFGIPMPDEQVFISWFQGGEVFRGGNCWYRGSGRIFYFSPGHELYPIYHQPEIQRVISNAVEWARPQGRKAEVPLHVPVENSPEKIEARGPAMHDASGKLLH
ncbi:MAG TPA: ThuA domain-containing protein [Verrucomicrobiae bacterium]|jgi:trehalose utilization protein|nr:ThuA domain-containing protein [Verrucomicrobiae bacterium]